MTTITMGNTPVAELIAEQEPGLISGYLADTARNLDAERSALRDQVAYWRTQYDARANELLQLRDNSSRFVSSLKEWADEEGSDSGFDDVLENYGFDRREREYRVDLIRYVTYRQTVSTYVQATDEDSAGETATDQDDNGLLSWETDYDSEETGSVTVDYTTEN